MAEGKPVDPDPHNWWMVEDKPDAPKCKHGLYECDKCGQKWTDVKHKTVGGKGVVGRLK